MNKSCSMRPRHAGTIAGAVAALFAASYAPAPLANPTGGQVVAGTVTIASPSAGQMNITQTSPKGIVNWNTFSIGSSEAVNIVQPSSSAALLNRVMGNDPSVIAGRLQANGKVFLVNPAGVVFVRGASVNVGSMVASTLNISNDDFLAGNYHFIGTSAASVTNAGTLTAGSGGTIALLGGSVSNSGTVSARMGTVAMGAGSDITLDFAGDGLTTLKINQGAANALIGNTGTLEANGGMVVMSAQTADALAGTVINQQGIVRAQSIAERDGHILLDGGTSGVTMAGGTLDATGGAGSTGGRIDVTGYNVALTDAARVDASGAAGGGVVRFGGGSAGQDPTIRNANAVWMSPTAEIHADALASGNGGNVVAFSNTASRLYGTLTAKGGTQGGDGGLIETSGHYLDMAGAKINASAPMGKGGTWLIDPADIDICHGTADGTCGVGAVIEVETTFVSSNDGAIAAPAIAAPAVAGPVFGPVTAPALTMVTDQQISNALNANTTVQVKTTDGDITMDGTAVTTGAAAIQKTEGAPSTLTLSASGSIIFNAGASIASTPAGGALNLVFDANVGNQNSANVIQSLGTLAAPVVFSTVGGNISMGVKEAQPGSFDGAAVQLAFTNIDTRINQSDTVPGGSVTIHGQAPGALPLTQTNVTGGTIPDLYAVGIFSSNIFTSTGAIELEGNIGTGTQKPVGGVAVGAATPFADGVLPAPNLQSTLSAGTGAIRIFGIGTDATGVSAYDVAGVRIFGGSNLVSNGGPIDIRGGVSGVAQGASHDVGVVLGYSTINAAGANGSISLTGSTNTSGTGVRLSSTLDNVESGGATMSTGQGGTITFRALNNGGSDSFQFIGTASATSPGGALVFVPGGVNTQDFSLTRSDATPINVNSDAAGLSVDAAALAALVGEESGFNSIIFGSTTQSGLVTVQILTDCSSGDCISTRPTFSTNLTLASGGAGSQGIALPYGVSMPNLTLTVQSAGPVTQNGGIVANRLLLDGPGRFTLSNAQNQVNSLAVVGTGDVTFVNASGLGIGITNGSEAGPITGLTFDSATNQTTPISGANSTISGNLTVETTSGNITVWNPITKNAGSDATFTLSAAGSIFDYANIVSTNGALNLVFDANVGNTISGNSISIQGLSPGDGLQAVPVDLFTNGGNLSIGAKAGQTTSFDGAAAQLGYVNIDTRVNSPNGPTGNLSNGSVTIHGQAAGAVNNYANELYSVEILGSKINTSTGNIDIEGNIGNGRPGSVGGVLLATAYLPALGSLPPASDISSLSTDSGSIHIYGAASDQGVSGTVDVDGVRAYAGTSIHSGSGNIDIRGDVVGASSAKSNVFTGDFGVELGYSKITTTASGSSVSITGSTDTLDPGLLLSSTLNGVESGGPTISAGPNGVVALQAKNAGTADSIHFVGNAISVSSQKGTLSMAPGGVDPGSFSLTSSDNTPINIFSNGAGFSVSASALGFFSGFQTISFGSPTQTGLITVNGIAACSTCAPTRPNFSPNLTLLSPGPGSQGINLPYGISMPGQALTLVSAGPVTDPGGIQAASLLLSGPGTFSLNDPQNAVGVLAMVNAGNVNFLNSGNLVIGPVTSQTYNPGTNTMQPLDGTNSRVTGNLVAQSATGNVQLNTNLSAGGSADLVAENGVFTAAPSSMLTAGSGGWRIWTNTWVGETRHNVQPGNVQPNFYGCTFGSGCSWGGTVPSTGNHYVYVQRPTLTVTADGKTRLAGAPNPTFTYSFNGIVNGDSAADALNGTVTSPATKNSPAGTYPIDPNFASSVGYIVNDVPATLNVMPTTISPVAQSGLQTFFTSQEQSFVYENNLQGTNICVGVNQPLFTETPPGDNQDLLAVEWKRVRSQPNLNSCMTTNGQHGCSEF
ncbi:filamentous hemagglutinin N-terminal domain-containing protein [Paraburkholderia fungorum]|uniref:two-partner secretion domain-containing protein n=1 Tax=Paraburkholderia fungorum TaxID=134537 RepID=UPI0038BB6F4B